MTRTVALLGATGYTGRLVAAELTRRGVPHRLGGRSEQRLAAVPSQAERVVVDITSGASLDSFLDGADVLITCVGPFAQHGMPIVEAAARTATPYVDSTGEPAFMAEVYDRFGSAATPIVPACGFDYIPGDLAAAIAVDELGQSPETVRVMYAVNNAAPTRGTALSAAGAIGGFSVSPRRMVLRGPDGPVTGVELPWGEQLTVPLHVPGASVSTAVGAPDLVARTAEAFAPLAALSRPMMRLATPLLRPLVDRLPEGPSAKQRSRASALVLAEASAGGGIKTVAVRVRDVYGMTARFLVEAALTVEGAGAMAPAQGLQPRAFLDACSYEDDLGSLSWQVL